MRRQHWIARVQDSINEYHEVQTAYFDGTEAQAQHYFRSVDRCNVIARYFGNTRYQIIMAANPVTLQEGLGHGI